MKKIAIAAFTLFAMTSAASAEGWWSRSGNNIDQRQGNQERRIEQGVRSGDITRSEYRQLEAEQTRIRDLERQAKRDGHVDRYEARRINEAQNAASRRIYEERHDREHRGRYASEHRPTHRGLWYRRWW